MNLIKRTATSWSRLCDSIFFSRKARRVWNSIICPAIEVTVYVLAAVLLALCFFILTASLVLLS
jgi:hypothetical protein